MPGVTAKANPFVERSVSESIHPLKILFCRAWYYEIGIYTNI